METVYYKEEKRQLAAKAKTGNLNLKTVYYKEEKRQLAAKEKAEKFPPE